MKKIGFLSMALSFSLHVLAQAPVSDVVNADMPKGAALLNVNAQASFSPGKANYTNSVVNFENFIIKHYHPDKHQINLLCENSCIFIRFKIVEGGKIDSLAFSIHTVGFSNSIKSTPSFITDALNRAFKNVENSRILTKELKSANRTYLLPFIFYYNSRCYVYRKAENSKPDGRDTTFKAPREQQESNAILNMLNFANKGYFIKNYTILNPIKVGTDDGKFFF